MVDRLADARDELGGALADPRPEVVLVPLLAEDPGDLDAGRLVRHDDQSLALAEAGGRRSLGEPGDALDDLAVDAAFLEPADGPALHDDVVELHRVSSGGFVAQTAVFGPLRPTTGKSPASCLS